MFRIGESQSKKKRFTMLFFFFIVLIITAQEKVFRGVVMDSLTLKPIPFSDVYLFDGRGTLTNEEGVFRLIVKGENLGNSLFISSMGYEKQTKIASSEEEMKIYLSPKFVELEDVVVSNRTYTIKEIINNIKKNIKKNYGLPTSKKQFFYRSIYRTEFEKFKIEVNKSTIPELGQDFANEIINSVPKSDLYYKEVLVDFYEDALKENRKAKIIKGIEVLNKESELNFNVLESKFNKIIEKHTKKKSYFKVRLGLLSFELEGLSKKDSTDLEDLEKKVEEKIAEEKEEKENYLKYTKNNIANQMSFLKNEKLTFDWLKKWRRYKFTMQKPILLDDVPVYVLKFEPDSYFADYKGVAYINASNFAVVRVDYHNVKPLKSVSLFGFSMNFYEKHIKIIFKERKDEKYEPYYVELTNGHRFGMDRKLTFLEKNKEVKGRRLQNKLKLDVDVMFNNHAKFQLLLTSSEEISDEQFEQFEEEYNALPQEAFKYNPSFWKGYDVITLTEELQALDFTSVSNTSSSTHLVELD